jgi:glycosyltransferase involved in cell wall biosynthesis
MTGAQVDMSTLSRTEERNERRKISILFLIPSLQMGGAEIQLLSLVKGLDKQKFAVTVAVFYHRGELCDDFEAIENIRVFYLEKKSAVDFFFLRNLADLLHNSFFDIIQSYNVSARIIGLFFGRLFGIRHIILTERNAKAVYSSPCSRLYFFLENRFLRFADLVVANSVAGQNFILSRNVPEEKTRIILNGIDEQRIRITRPPKLVIDELGIALRGPIVGMVARIVPQKDHETFLKATKIIIHVYPDARFILIGNGPEFDRMNALAKELRIDRSVYFLGHRPDVANYVNIFDVVLLTSRKSEGCSNALIEAMMLGKPVVTTRVAGNESFIQHEKNGFLVQPRNPEELAKTTLRLLGDETLRSDIGRRAKEMAMTQFSQESMVKSYEQLYYHLTKEHKLHD